jgi:hypothetical protein
MLNTGPSSGFPSASAISQTHFTFPLSPTVAVTAPAQHVSLLDTRRRGVFSISRGRHAGDRGMLARTKHVYCRRHLRRLTCPEPGGVCCRQESCTTRESKGLWHHFGLSTARREAPLKREKANSMNTSTFPVVAHSVSPRQKVRSRAR